jgi:hypothetical protein
MSHELHGVETCTPNWSTAPSTHVHPTLEMYTTSDRKPQATKPQFYQPCLQTERSDTVHCLALTFSKPVSLEQNTRDALIEKNSKIVEMYSMHSFWIPVGLEPFLQQLYIAMYHGRNMMKALVPCTLDMAVQTRYRKAVI